MVKHNNVVPNIHCHKKYLQSSRGPLKVKLALNQATRKKARRTKRAARAAAMAPRPVEMLRPVVHCPTQKYSAKTRLGRGFTLEELKVAKLHPSYARTIGIAVDHRRRNKSEESLALNVARLEEYKKKLVVLKKGDVAPASGTQTRGLIQPVVKPAAETGATVEMRPITQEMKDFRAYTAMRVAKKETTVSGYRVSVLKRKAKE